jgi:hypothetical protein
MFFLIFFILALPIRQKQKKIEEEEKEEEEEEEEEEGEESEEQQQLEKELTSKGPIIQKVEEWRKVSSWLFLRWNALEIKRPGLHWRQFGYQMTGKKVTIGNWRKVVETHSAKVNTHEEQQRLSSALLHTHRTGQRYYVSEDLEETTDRLDSIWTSSQQQSQLQPIQQPQPQPIQQLQTRQQLQSIQPIQDFQLQTFQSLQQHLTPTQQGYKYFAGDWQCHFCQNVNFARRTECKRCARKKNE